MIYDDEYDEYDEYDEDKYDEDEYEETFDRQSEDLINDAVEKIQKHIKAEALKKSRESEEENKKLRKRIRELEEENAELMSHKEEIEHKERTLESQFYRMKWSELTEKISATVYTVHRNYMKNPKCSCCDEKRMIHFTAPDGNEYAMQCKCNSSVTTYSVEEAHLYEMYIHKNTYEGLKAQAYYFRESGDSRDDYIHVVVEEGPISKIPDDWSSVDSWKPAFSTRELCQKYCDWLNKDVPQNIMEQMRDLPWNKSRNKNE